MTPDDDVERAILFALHSPPPFDGNYDDPWFSEGPVPGSAIADRLRSVVGATDAAIQTALSRLERDGLLHRADHDADGGSSFAWALTDHGAAQAERLPDRYLADLGERESTPGDLDDECEWRSLVLLG